MKKAFSKQHFCFSTLYRHTKNVSYVAGFYHVLRALKSLLSLGQWCEKKKTLLCLFGLYNLLTNFIAETLLKQVLQVI